MVELLSDSTNCHPALKADNLEGIVQRRVSQERATLVERKPLVAIVRDSINDGKFDIFHINRFGQELYGITRTEKGADIPRRMIFALRKFREICDTNCNGRQTFLSREIRSKSFTKAFRNAVEVFGSKRVTHRYLAIFRVTLNGLSAAGKHEAAAPCIFRSSKDVERTFYI